MCIESPVPVSSFIIDVQTVNVVVESIIGCRGRYNALANCRSAGGVDAVLRTNNNMMCVEFLSAQLIPN